MTKSCGGAIASTSPPGWTGSSSRAIPAISTLGELVRRQRGQVLAERGRERRPDRLRPQRAAEQLRARLVDREHLGQQLVEVEHLDVVLAQRRGEAVVLLLRALEPRHAVEQQVVVVARREPAQLGARAVQHHRAQPADLAPDAVVAVHDLTDATATMAVCSSSSCAGSSSPRSCSSRSRSSSTGSTGCCAPTCTPARRCSAASPTTSPLLPALRPRGRLLAPRLPAGDRDLGPQLGGRPLPARRRAVRRRHGRDRRRASGARRGRAR